MQKRPLAQAEENYAPRAAMASASSSATPARAASRPGNKPSIEKPQSKAAASKTKAKVKREKTVKHSFTMPESEHDAVVELKHKLSEVMGSKVKKSDLVRVALQLLLSQPQTKIKSGLVKLYGPAKSDS